MSDPTKTLPLGGELILASDPVTVIRILNPFDPREHDRHTIACENGATAASLVPAIMAHFEHVISINGKIIEEADYDKVLLQPGDHCVICPVPQGGGGNGTGKMVLRIVAIIAITYFSYGTLGPWAAGYFGGNAMVWGAVFAAAGSMMVNALLPVKPLQSELSDSMGGTSTYGIDGPKNASLEGIAVPVPYGKHRMAGNIISLHVENVDATQMVYMLVNAGEGPVFNLTDFKINDQDIDSFENVEWVTRNGTANQALIDWFDEAYTNVFHGFVLDKSQGWTQRTATGSADRLRFDVVGAGGIFRANQSNGALEEYTVEIEIQYRLVGSGVWLAVQDIGTIATANPVTDTPDIVTDLNPDGSGGFIDYPLERSTHNPIYRYQLLVTDKSRSPVRRSFSTGKVPYGVYEWRIRRKSDESTDLYISDKITLDSVYQVTSSKVAYNHTALVGVKIKLTDQLNGLPNLTYLNHGRVIKVWNRTTRTWGYGNSSNPAWVTLDALTHPRYGGQVPETRFDLESFKDWAKHCDDNDLEFNGVFDSTMTLHDSIQYVLRLGHAQIVNVGTRYSVVIERVDTPVMMFGVGNINKGTFSLNWLPMAERANEAEVTFFDRADGYKQKSVKVYDQAILNNGKPQRSAAFTLFGCTDELTAVKEGILALNMNKYLLQTCTFEAPIESLACAVGSLIYVQHDMPNWESSGRLATGSTTSVLKLDRQVTFVPGENYKALVHVPYLAVGSGTISSVDANNNYISLSGAVPATAKRLAVGGVDRACQPAQAGSGYLAVENVTGLSPGQAYTLYDSDVIIEQTITNPNTTTDTVSLTAPIAIAPTEFANWMIGPVLKVKRQFRVKMIGTGGDDSSRQLSCIQYDNRVYDLDLSNYGGPINPVNPLDPGYALNHVQNLGISEEVYLSGSQIKNRVVLTWSPPRTGIYKGADVYVAVNGEPLRLAQETVGTNRYSMDADVGSGILFKVVAFDMFNRRVNYDSAPTFKSDGTPYIVTGIATNAPTAPILSGLNIIWEGRDCKLYWRYNSRNNSYEIGSEPYGGDSGTLDPSILDFEIKVYHNNHVNSPDQQTWVYKRTEYSVRPAFVYPWEMNKEDGLKRHLKFEVRVRPRLGEMGQKGTVTAYNPPPILSGLYSRVPSFNSCELFYVRPAVTDFDGVLVYIAATSEIPETQGNLVYDGPNTSVLAGNLGSNTTYYVKAAAYDTFGKTGLIFTQPLSFTTGFMNITDLANSVIGVDWLDSILRARIDLVDGNLPGSVNARILGEAAEREAAILDEEIARQSEDSSLASRSSTLTAALVGVGAAGVQDAALASMTADGGMAAKHLALSTQYNNEVTAGILQEWEVFSGPNGTYASNNETLTTSVNLRNRTFFQNNEPSNPTNGIALTINDVWIDTDAANRRYMWSGSAWVERAENATINGNRIFRQVAPAPESTPSYTLRVGDVWFNVSNGLQGLVWSGTEWVPSDDARLDSHTTSIQTHQGSINGLSGQYTVKIDNNGYVSGFGLASTAVEDPATGLFRFSSEFEVLADKFSVRMPSHATATPFTVGAVDGVPSVIINNAYIGDATINNAKIGGEIHSDNYYLVDGITPSGLGWKISKAGAADFSALQIRGWTTGSVPVANNGSATVTHNLGRVPIVSVWIDSPNGEMAYIQNNGVNAFTVRAAFAGDTTVNYSYA